MTSFLFPVRHERKSRARGYPEIDRSEVGEVAERRFRDDIIHLFQ